jgi:hypothetical protein
VNISAEMWSLYSFFMRIDYIQLVTKKMFEIAFGINKYKIKLTANLMKYCYKLPLTFIFQLAYRQTIFPGLGPRTSSGRGYPLLHPTLLHHNL